MDGSASNDNDWGFDSNGPPSAAPMPLASVGPPQQRPHAAPPRAPAPPLPDVQVPDPFLSGAMMPPARMALPGQRGGETFPDGGIFAASAMATGLGAEPSPASESHLLGATLIALALGTGAGIYYGGPFGGVAGALLAGAGANLLRAGQMAIGPESPDARREALISLTWAAVSAAAGGYVAWRVYEQRSDKTKKESAP